MPSLSPNKRRPWEPAPVKRAYQSHAVRTPLYDSPLWRRVRADHLRRNPLCVVCQQRDVLTAATVLDHVVPVRDGADFFDTTNYQGLCQSCHASKSAQEGQQRRRDAKP